MAHTHSLPISHSRLAIRRPLLHPLLPRSCPMLRLVLNLPHFSPDPRRHNRAWNPRFSVHRASIAGISLSAAVLVRTWMMYSRTLRTKMSSPTPRLWTTHMPMKHWKLWMSGMAAAGLHPSMMNQPRAVTPNLSLLQLLRRTKSLFRPRKSFDLVPLYCLLWFLFVFCTWILSFSQMFLFPSPLQRLILDWSVLQDFGPGEPVEFSQRSFVLIIFSMPFQAMFVTKAVWFFEFCCCQSPCNTS